MLIWQHPAVVIIYRTVTASPLWDGSGTIRFSWAWLMAASPAAPFFKSYQRMQPKCLCGNCAAAHAGVRRIVDWLCQSKVKVVRRLWRLRVTWFPGSETVRMCLFWPFEFSRACPELVCVFSDRANSCSSKQSKCVFSDRLHVSRTCAGSWKWFGIHSDWRSFHWWRDSWTDLLPSTWI